ncbi:MAG: iron ABC transporter permease [Candidatus Azobacteroides sp.]|nr:iron ABC transporter permease [Candidatus Azobacteroides sp.]
MKFILLLLLLSVFFMTDVMVGSVHIPLDAVRSAFFDQKSDPVNYEIIVNYRLPKALTAVLVGASLSVAGVLMQTLFRNPLAGPDVLGVNAGAGLGVAIFTMLASSTSFSALNAAGSPGVVVAGICGAMLVLSLVILASLKITDIVSLLIVGIMFGSIAGACINILQNISDPDAVKLFIVWTFGSLNSVTWNFFRIFFPVTMAGLLLPFLIQRQMDILLLGDNYAKGLGVNILQMRLMIILCTALSAGTSTAFVGPVAFIGVTVPHIARGIFNTSLHRIVIPASMFCGAILLLVCDVISQLPGTGLSIPLNAVCALFGGPMIIWILLKERKSSVYF